MHRSAQTPTAGRTLLLVLALLLVLPAVADLTSNPALAGRIELAWDSVPDPDVVGYRVFLGSTPGAGDQGVYDVGMVTEWSLDNAPDCVELYIGVKAVDAGGQESVGFADYVVGMPQPFISRTTPDNLVQGDELQTIAVEGGNFTDGMQRTDVVFDDPDVRVVALEVLDCDQIELTLSVGPFTWDPADPEYNAAGGVFEEVPPAEIGDRAVTLTAPDGSGESVLGEDPDALSVEFLTDRVDIDGSGRVDGFDLARVALAFGDPSHYDPASDLDGNKAVDGLDLTILADWFSQVF